MKGLIIALVALGCVGGGYYVFDMTQRTHQAELKKAEAELRLKAKAEDAKKAQAEAKAAEDARKTAEAARKKSEAEKEKAKLNAEATKKAIELKAKEKAASEAAAKQAAAEKAKAEAATKQANAEKARAEAAKAAAEAKAKEEDLALRRAEAERKTAEAKLAETQTAAAIVKAAAEKSENERKEAEANAAAERDRKLRLYSRASLSRAEMVALQRAERLLALEESGHLARARAEAGAEDESAPDEGDTAAATDESSTEAPETNAVVAVTWPPEKLPEPPDGEKVAALQKKLDDVRLREHVRGARRCVAVFGERIDRAVADGRLVDAQSDRRALVSLVPDYMDVYIDLIDEARKAGNETVQGKRLDELIALVPAWRRTALFVRLLTHDEAYFSRALAGRIEKNEYVRAFRKIYDAARRDKGDRDERDEKVARICRTLATYVPDFETSPEWK